MAAEGKTSDGGAITIKKYANRRLYNTASSSYVTLDHLAKMVKDGKEFVVYDAKSGEDITRSVLTQIIVEEEAKGENLLPISFLRQVISFYGDSLAGIVPRYLEYSMQSFARNEERMRGMMHNALDGLFPINQMEELNKQNVAFFESAMKMFAPFYRGTNGTAEAAPRNGDEARSDAEKEKMVADLKAKLSEVERQLEALRRQAKGN